MRLLMPLVPDPRAPLPRANPVAKLAAALILMLVLFASLDGVTAVVILAAIAALVPLTGLGLHALLGRTWLILGAALSVAVFNILFAAEQVGEVLLAVGPIEVRHQTVLDGGGLALRLLAIAGSGVLATVTTQPTELADSLVQQLRVSPRFAVGALAALRLLPTFTQEWQTLSLARRARGVDAGRSPVATARLFGGQMFALLVGAIRRGTRMATAMEGRGFGAQECRTVARLMRMRAADWAWIAGAIVLGAAAVGISLALGTWRFLFA